MKTLRLTHSMHTGLSIVAITLFSISALSAAILVEYKFDSDTSATSVDANLTAGTITLGSGIAGSDAGRSGSSNSLFARASVTHTANQLSIVNAIADNDYFSFTVDVNAGYEMDLTSFKFDLGYTRSGAFDGKQFKAYLLTSIDGFVEAGDIVGSATVNVDINGASLQYPNGTTTISLAGTQFQNITTSTEFRIYIADNTGSNDYIHRIDNVVLNGTVSPIPELGSYALFGGLFALGCVCLRRRKLA